MGAMFVYAVTSYTTPAQTERLVRRLRRDSPASRIIVSHDRKAPTPSIDALRDVGAELWLTDAPITWGDASFLLSQLAVVRRAALAEADWLTFLTGQDYPIRPLAEYERHLSTVGADMLLEEPDGDPELPVLLRRYVRRSYRMPRWTDRHRIRQVVKQLPGWELSREPRGLPPYLHRPRLRTPFSTDFPLRKGGDLYALSGRAAAVLMAADPRLVRYYSRTRIPSESYPHTVLRNAPELANHAGLLHFTRWGSSSHPEWLGVDDLAEMLESSHWFARKFREGDPVLDELDSLLDGARGACVESS
jgi:hypothetical protein